MKPDVAVRQQESGCIQIDQQNLLTITITSKFAIIVDIDVY